MAQLRNDMTAARPVDTILRHPKERRSKCSVEPLRGRADLRIIDVTAGFRMDASAYILLEPEAPLLGVEDCHGGRPFLLLDATWRLVAPLQRCIEGTPLRRSLPPVATAYPRNSKLFADPATGLATVEALYLARRIAGLPTDGLLDAYHWRDAFLGNINALQLF